MLCVVVLCWVVKLLRVDRLGLFVLGMWFVVVLLCVYPRCVVVLL